MATQALLLLPTRIFLICLLLITVRTHHVHEEPELSDKAIQDIVIGETKKVITKLHFYFHDTFSGKNPTAVMVAKAQNSLKSSTLFGAVFATDDLLTVGPEPDSEIVGRAQGLYSMTDTKEIGAVVCMTFVFTGGEYNGSTLDVFGKNPLLRLQREVPVVGGTGVFRLAQGIATLKTYSFNRTSGNAVVEYNVVVLHYSNL